MHRACQWAAEKLLADSMGCRATAHVVLGAGQELPEHFGRRKRKGPARGDERGLRGQSPKRLTRENAAREEERPQSLRPQPGRRKAVISQRRLSSGAEIPTNANSERLPCAVRNQAGGALSGDETKKRPHPKMEPYESGGKRTREEETPFAVGSNPGRRIGLEPMPRNAGPREEDSVGVSATRRICGSNGLSAMHEWA